MRRHVESVHLGMRHWKCAHSGCELSFTQKGHRLRHERSAHPSLRDWKGKDPEISCGNASIKAEVPQEMKVHLPPMPVDLRGPGSSTGQLKLQTLPPAPVVRVPDRLASPKIPPRPPSPHSLIMAPLTLPHGADLSATASKEPVLPSIACGHHRYQKLVLVR